jgi:beta-galactosidase GanA
MATIPVTPYSLGVCYYPEQWDSSKWPEDFSAMRDLGLRYVRIGEFAWSRLEPAPGNYGWAAYNPAPYPGMVRLWTHEAFAHGAEVVSYFRWRQAPFAQEQMHHGINRPDGTSDVATDEIRVTLGSDRSPNRLQNIRLPNPFQSSSGPAPRTFPHPSVTRGIVARFRANSRMLEGCKLSMPILDRTDPDLSNTLDHRGKRKPSRIQS